MIDRMNSISEGETWEGAFFLESGESSTRGVSHKNIKKGGEGASLPYPSGGFEKFLGPAID